MLWFLASCYSFNGIDVGAAKSLYVDNFLNRAGGGPPFLAQTFTENLKEYFQRNSSLKLGGRDSDMQIKGNIVGYRMEPIAATSQDRAAQNRLTIEVEVNFVNNLDNKKNYNQRFSFYSDFPQNQTLAQVENDKIREITEQIILDIFNKSLADW